MRQRVMRETAVQRVVRTTAVLVAATSFIAFGVWAYRDIGAIWMLQSLRVCG